MAWNDLSRSSGYSPGSGHGTEWISRQVVGFGRYPEKRPKGLKVNACGAILVSSLIETWGRSHGITEEKLLAAIQRHMFDEQRPATGNLRFSLDNDEHGNMLVRVHPKRGHARNGESCSGTHGSSAIGATPARAQLRSQANSSPANSSDGKRKQTWQAKSSDGKRTQTWQDKEPPWKGTVAVSTDEKEEQTWEADSTKKKGTRSWEEVSVPKYGHLWYKDSKSQTKKKGGANNWSKAHKPKWSSRGVQVQKWLGWALKSGYRELGIELEDFGSARVSEIVEALLSQRPQLGISDEDSLEKILEETDTEGRFEIDTLGRIRKVPRSDRRPRKSKRRSSESPDNGGNSEAGHSDKRSRSRSRPRLRSRSRSSESQTRSWLPQANVRSFTPRVDRRQQDKSRSPSPKASSRNETADASDGPAPPPGEYWTNYKDDDKIWWYYDGPKGKWWCIDSNRTHIDRFPEEGAEGASSDAERE